MKSLKKTRGRTLATLLIALFIISTIAFAVPLVSAQDTWYIPGDFSTIQDAIDSVNVGDGDTILVGSGNWFGAEVDKSVEIRGEDGAVIDDGPVISGWQFGFRLYSDGVTISHFTFQGVELAVYGKVVDDITVEHNKIYDTVQGISNWDGNNWIIRHNVIEWVYATTGGGIGIAFGSRNSPVSGNIVTHNKIVSYFPDDRTFSVGGILLCADKRYGWVPGEVTNNKIVHNKVKATGIDCWAIALQVIGLSSYDPVPPAEITYATGILYDNIVGFNDLRGSDFFVECLPVELEGVNTISRNLGKDANMGHGKTPANIFNPVI